MSEKRMSEANAVSFSERLASSQVFASLFRDGMGLVEETASYLDGAGRTESKKLERNAALVYATESMRLTTRLMQLASWLLLHRAVKEGEMTLAQAHKEKKQGAACRLRPRRCQVDRAIAGKTAGTDRALDQTAGGSAPARQHHACVAADQDAADESGRAATRTAQSRVSSGTAFRA